MAVAINASVKSSVALSKSQTGKLSQSLSNIITVCAGRSIGGYNYLGALLKFHIAFKMKLSDG